MRLHISELNRPLNRLGGLRSLRGFFFITVVKLEAVNSIRVLESRLIHDDVFLPITALRIDALPVEGLRLVD